MSVYHPDENVTPKNPPSSDSATSERLAEAFSAAIARAERAEAERDRFEAALGRACLVGGTTYLLERAERAEAALAMAEEALQRATSYFGGCSTDRPFAAWNNVRAAIARAERAEEACAEQGRYLRERIAARIEGEME